MIRSFYSFTVHAFLFAPPSEMLSWPNSPLLVLLQFVDPNVLTGEEDEPLEEDEARETLLIHLADLAATSDYSTHVNQLILAKQLVEHGANVNAVSIPQGETPLHKACFSGIVTNLDLIEFLLEAGADPNAHDQDGLSPLIYTTPAAPGAAKFLMNWPTTDVNINTQSRESFMDWVRIDVKDFSDKVALPDNSDQIQDQFVLRQWREIEEMLVEGEAADTGLTVIE
jgi:hypothetical protein